MKAPDTSLRLFYLDWLRIIAFSILLFEHSAEIFTDWKFWIKNEQTSSFLSYTIAFFLPWRMPLLFLISGAAVTLSFKRKSITSYFKERSVRLLLPLAFSILVIIPPQLYFIQLYRGSNQSFLQFYQDILTLNWKISPKGNIHFMHLWYLAYLFVYCLAILPVLLFARSENGKRITEIVCNYLSRRKLVLFIGPLATLPYYTASMIRDFDLYTAPFLYYFPFFVCGALLFANSTFNRAIKRDTGLAFCGAMLLTGLLYFLSIINKDPHNYFLNLGKITSLPLLLIKSVNQWLWVVAIFGIAMRLLNSGSERLRYATQAIYPFYILHQTVIVIAGYFIVSLQASLSYKLALIILLSFGSIYLFYEYFIRRTNWVKVLFGVKPEVIKNEEVKHESPRHLVMDRV